jgi:hypothetical protein
LGDNGIPPPHPPGQILPNAPLGNNGLPPPHPQQEGAVLPEQQPPLQDMEAAIARAVALATATSAAEIANLKRRLELSSQVARVLKIRTPATTSSPAAGFAKQFFENESAETDKYRTLISETQGGAHMAVIAGWVADAVASNGSTSSRADPDLAVDILLWKAPTVADLVKPNIPKSLSDIIKAHDNLISHLATVYPIAANYMVHYSKWFQSAFNYYSSEVDGPALMTVDEQARGHITNFYEATRQCQSLQERDFYG